MRKAFTVGLKAQTSNTKQQLGEKTDDMGEKNGGGGGGDLLLIYLERFENIECL